jgi:hypothetical protein
MLFKSDHGMAQVQTSDLGGTIAGSQLPSPSSSVFGGVKSLAATANKFLTSIGTDGIPVAAQPAFTDISGTASTGQIPNLSATILTSGLLALARGGLNLDLTATGGASFFLKQNSSGGAITVVRPALADLSDSATVALLASPTFTGTPAAPTAAAGTNTTQLATCAFAKAMDNNAAYTTLLNVAGSHTAAKVAGTYAIGYGDPLAVGGTGTLYPLGVLQIVAADLPTINGITTKLRIRAQLYTNDVAPTGNFTFGLYPITRPGTSGGAGLCIYTLGTVVSGSNGATFTTPAADLLGSAVGSDFALPADGPYVIAVVTTATIATSAHVHVNAQLQVRNA